MIILLNLFSCSKGGYWSNSSGGYHKKEVVALERSTSMLF